MLRSKAGDINSKTGRKNGGHMPKIHMYTIHGVFFSRLLCETISEIQLIQIGWVYVNQI